MLRIISYRTKRCQLAIAIFTQKQSKHKFTLHCLKLLWLFIAFFLRTDELLLVLLHRGEKYIENINDTYIHHGDYSPLHMHQQEDRLWLQVLHSCADSSPFITKAIKRIPLFSNAPAKPLPFPKPLPPRWTSSPNPQTAQTKH